jgi:hypothetical protein
MPCETQLSFIPPDTAGATTFDDLANYPDLIAQVALKLPVSSFSGSLRTSE